MSCRCSSIRSSIPGTHFSCLLNGTSCRPWLDGASFRSDPRLASLLAPTTAVEREPGRPDKQIQHRGRRRRPPSRIRLPPDHQWPQTFSCAYPGKAEAEISRSLVLSIFPGPLEVAQRVGNPKRKRRKRTSPDSNQRGIRCARRGKPLFGWCLVLQRGYGAPVHSLEPSVSPKQRTGNGRLPNSTVTVGRLHCCADRPPGQLPFSKNHPPKPLCGFSSTPWAQWRAKASSSCHGRCGSR